MRDFKGNIKYFNRKQQMQYNSKKEYGEEYFLLEIKKKKILTVYHYTNIG